MHYPDFAKYITACDKFKHYYRLPPFTKCLTLLSGIFWGLAAFSEMTYPIVKEGRKRHLSSGTFCKSL